jgi:hypothetical protein
MNILIVGDSISSMDACGLESQLDKHYIAKIESNNHQVTNLSIGGQSNQKIMHKICLEVSKNPNYYDLIIVQWSSLFRINLNKGDTLYDGSINFNMWKPNLEKRYNSFWSSWVKYFIHPRIEILESMTQLILLDQFLANQPTPYVFVKGFDNFFNDLKLKNFRMTSDDFKSNVLKFDNHPDWEIEQTYNELVFFYNIICKQLNWLNLYSESWYDSRTDVAADNIHPGPQSHLNYYNSLESYINRLGLSFNQK